MTELYSKVFWLDRNNTIVANLSLTRNAHFDALNIEYLNGEDLDSFIDDIVQHNGTADFNLSGDKIFRSGFNTRDLHSYFINDINFEDFMLKSKSHEMYANVIVNGNVWVDKNLSTRFLNDVDLNDLNQIYSSNENFYTIAGK